MILTPSDRQIVLLPQDRELMAMLGLSEAEYRYFLKECIKHSRIEPGLPVNFELVTFLVTLAVGALLSLLSAFLFRPKIPRPVDIRQTSLPGQNVVGRSEYAPKSGFDTLQNVVELGSSIPLVYANRETIDGVTYGGIRVNTNLVWSQMQSQGGSQLLRAVCLIGEGLLAEIDASQFAFGDNLLGGYDLSDANSTSSRVTFYVSRDGGRLISADRVAGRTAINDPGNAENDGATDVFQIRGFNNDWTTDFCYAFKPSTQTKFGVYQLIGNGLAFRVNPALRPAVTVKTEPVGDDGDIRLVCEVDGVANAQRQKYNNLFSSRAGITELNGSPVSGPVSLAVGDSLKYYFDPNSDANTVFIGVQNGPDHEETCRDVAQTVSGRQRSWDDALSVGDLYKFGSALVVCESRTPDDDVFISEIDQEPIGGGQSMSVMLRVVRAGSAVLNPTSGTTSATSSSHLYKVAIASFSMPRAAQVIELGLRSTLGVRISGLCNFRDSLSQAEIDGRACNYYNGRVYAPGASLELSSYQSGSYSGAEQRYSFFKIGYRVAGSSGDFVYLSQCFGARSLTQQAVYNYIRLQMPAVQRWEFRIEPLSGWEIRNSIATGTLEVLDSRISGIRTLISTDGNEVVTIYYSGEPVARSADIFAIPATRDANLGVTLGDTADYADAWGKLAEAYSFEELQTSARSPEHELVYVNILTPNPNVPQYDDIALIGMNLRSTTEFSQLNQLSVYINRGLAGGIHTFPEVFNDLLTSNRYGVGAILSPEQIDADSITETALWTRDRRYFFDGAISQPLNLRQWASQTAQFFLLDLVIRNGKFALQPAVYFDRPEPITNLYTAGNILEDSFEFVYAEVDQRTPNRVSVKWRQEKASIDDAARGLFPIIREVTVREVGTPEDAPLEALDLTDFCTSEEHAIDVAKFICRGSRLITHSVRFKTVPTQAALEVGRCFKLGLETTAYEQPNNGAIDSNGYVTSTEPLPDGDYTALLWDGTQSSVQEVNLSINGQRAAVYRNAVFCIKEGAIETRAYKVQSLGFDEDGNIAVEAIYFPLNANGYSIIVDGWEVDSNWIIEGAIGISEDPGTGVSAFAGVNITGPGTVTVNVISTFAALVSGGEGTYTYAWSGSGVTFGSATAASTTVTATSSGSKTISCAVTKDGQTITANKSFMAITAPALTTIGTVTIGGVTTTASNIQRTYTATYSGDADSSKIFYSWTTSPRTATIVDSGTAAAKITFKAAGTYTVSCRVSSTEASDSPVTQNLTVTVT